MNFLKTSFYSGISTFVSLTVKLITNKIIAVYLGTNGMFILGQIRDFINIGGVLSHFGTTSGTIKYAAQYKDNEEELNQFLGTSLKLHLWFSIVVCLLTYVFREDLSIYLFNDSKFTQVLTVLAISFITLSLHTLILSVLNGFKIIKLYTTILVIASILSAAVLIYLVINYQLIGALYSIAINQILVFVVALVLVIIYKPFQFNLLTSAFKFEKFKKLLNFSLISLAGPLCLIAATFFVRYFLNQKYGSDYAGSWEGMWRISAIYLMFLTTTFKFYLLPTFSALEGKALKKEIFNVWKYVLPTICVIVLVVYLVKDIAIELLFTKEFMLITVLMGFHLLGDIVKINTWVLGNVLISKAKSLVFTLFQIEWALGFITLTYFMVAKYGFVGVSIAYLGANLIHFTLMNIYFRKLLWIKPKD